MARKKSENVFIVMWDETGLEGIVPLDLSEMSEKKQMQRELLVRLTSADGRLPEDYASNPYAKKIGHTLWAMKMRAQANGHRHYEIYILTTSKDITQKVLENLFAENPQAIVDLIREKGKVVFDGRRRDTPVIT